MKWVKPHVLNIIVAMNVSLCNEIEVTNEDIIVARPLIYSDTQGHQASSHLS